MITPPPSNTFRDHAPPSSIADRRSHTIHHFQLSPSPSPLFFRYSTYNINNMASTRNKNTQSDYCIEQNTYRSVRNHVHYENGASGRPFHVALPTPSVGILPSRMSREAFAANSVDIESAIWGISSTNLVSGPATVMPELVTLPEVSYFDRMQLFMPKPLVVDKNQRPLLQ